jgi:hypothetical protein
VNTLFNMDYTGDIEIFKEGFVVSLGQNMFSLPKLLWFSLRSTGLFYSTRERGEEKIRVPESLIEFESMFVRVEKLDDENSRFSYKNNKIDVYCLRVGDKRKCRMLCFTSWEERDFWVIAILTAIAQFKISGSPNPQSELCGKIRYGTTVSTLRAGHLGKSGSTSSARVARTSLRRSFRKKFGSLRSRKSTGNLSENLYSSTSDVFADTNTETYKPISPGDKIDENGSSKGFFKSGWDVIRRRSPSQLTRTGSFKM